MQITTTSNQNVTTQSIYYRKSCTTAVALSIGFYGAMHVHNNFQMQWLDNCFKVKEKFQAEIITKLIAKSI